MFGTGEIPEACSECAHLIGFHCPKRQQLAECEDWEPWLPFKALARGEQTGTRRLMMALDALDPEELATYRAMVGGYVASLAAAVDAAPRQQRGVL